MDIGGWLRGLGLERYEQAFRDNEIDLRVLRELTADDLKELGVAAIGHRRLLLKAIADLAAGAGRAAAEDVPAASPANVPAEAERRQLTVMFCDLVGSTALSARFDPEDLREIVGAYHRCVTDTVGHFGGFVAKYMGDGVLIYFGYPEAHEDDAERAARAGLAVIDAVGRLATQEPLNVRIGIATGLVVVGDLIGAGAAQERGVVGETPNLAARLQALAPPGTLVVADSTRRQIGTLFEIEDLGPQPLAGFAEPQPAWRVVGESGVVSRFEALRSGTTPLVGRDEELDLLLRRWQQAKSSEGRVVLISAEPGIGKSRLAEAFRETLAGEPHTRLRYFCSPFHQDSALSPFIGQLERAAGFERDDTPRAKLSKLAALVAANMPEEGDLQSLAELLALPLDDRDPALDLTPQRKKEKTFEALLRQLAGLARRQPVLIIFEDLHWADPSSRELLDLLIVQIEHMSVLLIATSRPDFQASWADRPHVTALSLRRLGRDESDRLIRGLVGDAGLPTGVLDEIVERTDGVPLFLEELTKAVLEDAAVGPLPAASARVPATLHASLMARLDRLGLIAKEIAQAGAAIGREFSYELLGAAVQRTEAELLDGLGRLVAAGLVFQRGIPPEALFLFKHALVQDTAYSMLLRGPRQALHARIAAALEQRFPTLGDTQPEILAHHFTEAGLVEKAVAYWCRAGRQSEAKAALVEAIAQLRRGLRLIVDLPKTRERARQELELEIALAGALRSAKGFSHPEVAETFDRARSLVLASEEAGTISHFSVLFGQVGTKFHGGQARTGLEHAREFLALAQSRADSGLLVTGYQIIGQALIGIGDYRAAFPQVEQGAKLYESEKHRMLDFQIASDPGVTMRGFWALGLWHQGYPDRASEVAREVLRHARRPHAHPYHSLGLGLLMVGMIVIAARRVSEAEEIGNEAVAVGNEHGFPTVSGTGLILQGWALARRGANGTAAERIRNGIAAARLRSYEPIYLGVLAEALALTGSIEEGLAAIAEALTLAQTSGARGNDAELHRLRGELLGRLPSPNWAKVETCFRTALAIARQQGTRGLELRAAASLARLLSEQARGNEAHDLLAPVYGWFTEGFNTPDLKEAKSLLDQLVD